MKTRSMKSQVAWKAEKSLARENNEPGSRDIKMAGDKRWQESRWMIWSSQAPSSTLMRPIAPQPLNLWHIPVSFICVVIVFKLALASLCYSQPVPIHWRHSKSGTIYHYCSEICNFCFFHTTPPTHTFVQNVTISEILTCPQVLHSVLESFIWITYGNIKPKPNMSLT